MKHINILNSRERKAILKELNDMFGVETLPDLVYFYFEKKEKIYVATREVFELEREELRVNMFGLYFGTIMKDGFRLSLEGMDLVKKQITKNIFEINQEQLEAWLKGEDLEVENKEELNTYLILQHNNDFVGCGKLKEKSILNYLPKARKLKKVLE